MEPNCDLCTLSNPETRGIVDLGQENVGSCVGAYPDI